MSTYESISIGAKIKPVDFLQEFLNIAGLEGEISTHRRPKNPELEWMIATAYAPHILLGAEALLDNGAKILESVVGFKTYLKMTSELRYSTRLPEEERRSLYNNLRPGYDDMIIKTTLTLLKTYSYDIALRFYYGDFFVLRRISGELTLNNYLKMWTPKRLEWVDVPYIMVNTKET